MTAQASAVAIRSARQVRELCGRHLKEVLPDGSLVRSAGTQDGEMLREARTSGPVTLRSSIEWTGERRPIRAVHVP